MVVLLLGGRVIAEDDAPACPYLRPAVWQSERELDGRPRRGVLLRDQAHAALTEIDDSSLEPTVVAIDGERDRNGNSCAYVLATLQVICHVKTGILVPREPACS